MKAGINLARFWRDALLGSYRNTVVFSLLFIVVFLSRLPFLGIGYGVDADAWRIVRAGQKMAATGQYVCSREPCYPLPEITYSLLTPTTDIVFNGLTALLSAFGAIALAGAIKRLGGRGYFFSALAFAFVPVVYFNSANSMDYMWSLSLLLISIYLLVSNRFLSAGIFLGLAVGSRITAGAMFLPLSLFLLWSSEKSRRWHNFALFAVSSALVAMGLFLPVYLKKGLAFLSFVETQKLSLHATIERMSLDVWGLLGIIAITVGLLIMIVIGIFSRKRRNILWRFTRIQKAWAVACVLAIAIYTAAFFRLPAEAGYMIPVVPFVIALFGLFLPRFVNIPLCVLFVASSFVFDSSVSSFGRCKDYKFQVKENPDLYLCITDQSPTVSYYNYRKGFDDENATAAKHIARIASNYQGKVVIVAGVRAVMLNIKFKKELGDNVKVEYLLSRKKLKKYRKDTVKLLVLTDANRYNKSVHGVDLSAQGATVVRLK